MQLLKFVPIKLTLFLVLGILIGNYFNFTLISILSITFISLIILGWLFVTHKSTKSALFGIITFILTICIGILSTSIHNSKNSQNHYSKFSISELDKLHLKITEVLKPNSFSARYYAKVTVLNKNKTEGKILLIIPNDSSHTNLNIDQELITYAKIDEINAPLNPHEFDYKNYLENIGVYNQIYAKSSDLIFLNNYKTTIYGLAAKWRNTITSHLKEAEFKDDELGVIQALLLGERNDISEETYTNYKNAGAIHILAVSGLHIGILLLILQFLLQPIEQIRFGKKFKLIIIVSLLWGFAFLAGLSASVVRAVTMFTFLAYAESLNRPANKFNILALSMFFILLIKPNYLYQVGFQMSYLAVFAIMWIYPMLQRFWFPKNKIVKYIWQLLSVSVAAQIGVLPISLFYFHQFPSLFFITNLAIIPFLGFILAFGIVVIILALLNIIPSFIATMYNEIIQLMNLIVAWIAQQESFVFRSISFDGTQLLLAYCTLILMVLAFSKPTYKRIANFLFGVVAFQIWLLFSHYIISNKREAIVLHQSRNTGLLYQNGADLNLLSNNPNRLDKILDVYATAEFTKTISIDSLKNSYLVQNKHIYIMDSLAIYPPSGSNITHVLLTKSPKVNLERLLDSLKPAIIIADGSNFKSDVLIWKETCHKRKLPFHYTGEKGAYYFNLKN